MTVPPGGEPGIAAASNRARQDDAWFASSCALCYGTCSTRVHRVDGVAQVSGPIRQGALVRA